MKKSFMTRVLATGLSLAMAFSLAATTNVSTAAAAAKPKMVTSAGESASALELKVGEATKIKVNATTKKTYRVSSVKVSSNKLRAAVNKAGTVVTIRGLKATPEGKQAAAKVSFETKKTGKASKYTYTTKVVVKEDKLTMTAEATGVKKIAVTFNKAVDTTTAKIVVKKGSATPTIGATTFAADAKSAEIVMGTKLTAGTYTVQATVGEDTLTADVTVQDEKMTSFELVSKNLVAYPDQTTKASISYKALNQYGEMMAPGSVQATCSFGTVDKVASSAPTADKTGKIVVDDINTALAIVGTTGTIVLVDTTNGVNLNETITYQSKAVASAAEVLGIYSDKTEKLVDGDLTSGSKVTDYYMIMNVQNQYGSDMSVSDIADSECTVSFNPASVITNLTISATNKEIKTGTTTGSDFKEITFNGKNCILVKLYAGISSTGAIDKAGTLSMTIVSANKGVIANPTITVVDAVTIASLSVAPADTVYDSAENKLVVEAIDTNGNAVTKYDDLKKSVTATTQYGTITLKKNADGTGTFYYKPSLSITPKKDNQYKGTEIATLMFSANDTTSGKYIVKPVSVTVYGAQQAWKVAGTTADSVTAVAMGEELVFDLTKLNYEDQYGNTIDFDKVDSIGSKSKIKYVLKDSDSVFGTSSLSADEKKITFSAPASAKKGTATLFLQYESTARTDESQTISDVASAEKFYDIKVDLSVVDVSSVTAADMTLNVNDGKMVRATSSAAVEVTKSAIKGSQADENSDVKVVVTARVGGKNVVIPTGKYEIISDAKLGGYGKVSAKDNVAEKTETKTVTVVVDSSEGAQTLSADVVVSNADPKATEIKKADAGNKITSVAVGNAVENTNLASTIKVLDQYGMTMSPVAGDIVYKIVLTGANQSQLKVEKDGTKVAKIVLNDGVSVSDVTGHSYTADVTFTYGGISFTQEVTIQF